MSSNLSMKKGFTLIELMLVLAIMTGIIVMMLRYTTQRIDETRRDRVVVQLQQIQNAALAYYVANGKWPLAKCDDVKVDLTKSDLMPQPPSQLPDYLPKTFSKNPYQQAFQVSCNATTNNFFVETKFPNNTEAQIVAGRIPLGSVLSGTNTVQTLVNLPGQNLNNARAVNFANIYHPGGCVPAPNCPNPNMVREIMVVPVSVSGLNDPGTSGTGPQNVYPISSFTAYAQGEAGALSVPVVGGFAARCDRPNQNYQCMGGTAGGKIDPNTAYWRVCLKVATAKGDVIFDDITGKQVSVLAITRCSPPQEPFGSDFTVFSP